MPSVDPFNYEKAQEIVDRLENPETVYVDDDNAYDIDDPKKAIVDRQPVPHEPADTHYTKNYGDYGGNKTIVNGELAFSDDAVVTNFPE